MTPAGARAGSPRTPHPLRLGRGGCGICLLPAPGREVRPTAKGEEMPREGGGAVGGLPDLRQFFPRLGRERALVLKQRDVAQDAGEEVVEVVRDAADELGDVSGAAEL